MTDMLTSVLEHTLSEGNAFPALAHGRSPVLPSLLRTIETAVIPRLHAALQNNLRQPRHPIIRGGQDCVSDVSAFAGLMLAGDLKASYDRVDILRLRGRSLERVYIDLLAPTAFHLRDLWSDDFCGFADVTLALCNLQSVLRHYASEFCAEADRPETGLRALIVSAPQPGTDIGVPMFGLLLMSQFFRRDGWGAWIERDLSTPSFRDAAVGEWFDLVEVLAQSDKQLDEIASGIRAIRRGSPNPAIGVIVCGQVFNEHPEFVRLVGADLVASDPLSSLSQAKSFITRATQRKRLA